MSEHGEDPIVGIDLGMTSVVMAQVGPNGIPEVIPLEGNRSMPAVVRFDHPDGPPLVGRAALSGGGAPERTLTGLKRLLGRAFASQAVSDLASRVAFRIAEGKAGRAEILVSSRSLDVAEVTGHLLNHARLEAEKSLDRAVQRCVVAVPAYFNSDQKAAVQDSVGQAGMELVRLVHEPTAVALAYGFNQGPDARIVIVDMGGVRLDISVLEIAGNVFDVVTTDGDPYLGGASLDARVVRWIAKEIMEQHGIEITASPALLNKARQAAEQAKRALSRVSAVDLNLPLETISSPPTAHLRLDSEIMDSLSKPLVDRVTSKIQRALEQRSLQISDVDEILLVGGGTRIPSLKQHLAETFGPIVRDSLPPEQVVALGAALLGDSLAKPVPVDDFAESPIGIALSDGRYLVVIDKASRLPLTRRVMIPTARDRQRSVEVDFFEGESGDLIDAQYLGSVVYGDLEEANAGESKLVVDLSLQSDRVLRVSSPEPGRAGEQFSFPVTGHGDRKNGQPTEPALYVAQELPRASNPPLERRLASTPGLSST